jgi:hypothetical protein
MTDVKVLVVDDEVDSPPLQAAELPRLLSRDLSAAARAHCQTGAAALHPRRPAVPGALRLASQCLEKNRGHKRRAAVLLGCIRAP